MLSHYLTIPEVENERRALNVFYGMRGAKKEGRWMGTAPAVPVYLPAAFAKAIKIFYLRKFGQPFKRNIRPFFLKDFNPV
jgi:hypothetical protein